MHYTTFAWVYANYQKSDPVLCRCWAVGVDRFHKNRVMYEGNRLRFFIIKILFSLYDIKLIVLAEFRMPLVFLISVYILK